MSWAALRKGAEKRLLFFERFSTEQEATPLEYATIFKETLELLEIQPSQIEGGILSSVVPSVTGAVKEAVEKYTGARILVVGPGLKTGLKMKVDDPAQQGSDLIVGAVAGVNLYPVPQILIDMGTATTVSVIDRDRAYIGKNDSAGPGRLPEALSSRAAQLPRISLDPPGKLIGSNTVDSMKSGILYGSAGALDGLIDRITKSWERTAPSSPQAGLACVVAPLCRHRMVLEDDLLPERASDPL